MTAEDLLSGDRRVCTTGRFVMIALDSNGTHANSGACSRLSGHA